MTVMEQMGQAAKTASRQLATAGEKKNDALKAIADSLDDEDFMYHQTLDKIMKL